MGYQKDFGPHCVTPVSCCSMSTSFVIMTKKLQEMVENEHIFQLVIIFMDHSTFSEVFATTYLLLPIPFLLLLLHNAAKLFLILKVQKFWEGHKILYVKTSSNFCCCWQIWLWRFFQILWPSQNIWILLWSLCTCDLTRFFKKISVLNRSEFRVK